MLSERYPLFKCQPLSFCVLGCCLLNNRRCKMRKGWYYGDDVDDADDNDVDDADDGADDDDARCTRTSAV